MSQHDFNIANQGFPAFRTDLNNGLTALATNSSGATAPSTTYAYQWWYDTTTNILKMRNADNDAWINFANFDQVNDLWSVTSLRATTEVRTPAVLDATGGNTATINGIPLRPGVLDPENRIINGAFDFWQRGTSFTTAVYGADRWLNSLSGGTVTMSRQSFTVGDTLGNNSPTFFLRQSTSGQTLASHFALTQQRIEGVRAYAGQTITILGWARRSSGTGNMAIEMSQSFGTGGSPSADVTGTGQTVTLTSSWAAFAVTIAVPSITGKTLGSNGNDYLAANFWTSAGSNFNARTNSLGLQTIGVDLWGIHIKQGTHTVAAADLYRQPELGTELARCQRYYTSWGGTTVYERIGLGQVVSNVAATVFLTPPMTMRGTPALSTSGSLALIAANGSVAPATSTVGDGITPYLTTIFVNASGGGLTAGNATQFVTNNNTTARLALDSEL